MNSTINLAGEILDYDTEFAIAMPPECHRALRELLRKGSPPYLIQVGDFTLEIKICWVGRPEATFDSAKRVTLKASRRNLNQLIVDLEDLSIPNHPLDHFHLAVTGEGTRRNLQSIVFERTGDDDYARAFFGEELAERSSV